MHDDLLRRAAELANGMSPKNFSTIHELIAEVEKWKSAALDETKRRKAVAAELGATQNEVERMRSEHELFVSPGSTLEAALARIKELEALNECLMENGNDLRERCQKAEALNERLEAAFLDAKKELQIYKKLCPNPSYVNASDRVDYWSEHEAREALEELRRSG